MKIAICDDEILFARQIEVLVNQYIKEHNLVATTYVFLSPKDFLSSELEAYDIVFLDVMMGELNGMDVAQSFREQNSNAVLVFVSAFAEFAHRGYKLNTFRYLLKVDLTEEFESCMNDALHEINKASHQFKFKTTDGEIKLLLLSDILYFECVDHNVFVHLLDKTHKTYDSLTKIETQLPLLDFLRVQRSYIVNMRNVDSIKYCEMLLANNKILTCSRSMREAVHRRFLEIQGEC